MTAACELGTARPARRALAEKLPVDVAAAAAGFVIGPLLAHPRRVGKPLGEELTGIYSARPHVLWISAAAKQGGDPQGGTARDWRVLYEIDDARQVVIVLDIRPRSTAYRSDAAPVDYDSGL